MSYGPEFREQRRVFHAYLSRSAVHQYRDAVQAESRAFPLRVLNGMNDHLEGVRLCVF